jgi:recombination protein RecR
VPEERALALADAIREARERVRPCTLCRCPSEADPCPICSDASRDRSLLLVVETARDLAAIEAGGAYRGLYFVLGGRLSPLDGSGADALDLEALRERARGGEVREACLATNPDLEGDGTALLVARALDGTGVRVTRLARGLPAGGQIEHQSATVIAEAFEGRRSVEG